jgi:hypothetical protein
VEDHSYQAIQQDHSYQRQEPKEEEQQEAQIEKGEAATAVAAAPTQV